MTNPCVNVTKYDGNTEIGIELCTPDIGTGVWYREGDATLKAETLNYEAILNAIISKLSNDYSLPDGYNTFKSYSVTEVSENTAANITRSIK